MTEFNIALIPGDGIGPEIIAGAVKVLESVAEKYNHKFNFEEVFMGGCAIDKFGTSLPDESIEKVKHSDSVLLGAVGGPKWDNVAATIRPESGLLKLRKSMGLYSNLRPAVLNPQLTAASPLKNSKLENGLDIMVVRELTGGIYFGKHELAADGSWASDEERYSVNEIERIGRIAFNTARLRGKKLTSVDKANVLESSRLWRKTMAALSAEYPDVELLHMYVDNAAMQLAINPAQFDVLVTSNLFGDILSDLSSAIVGSIGMLPSASLGENSCGLYEPIHGSAPDIAGKDIANPIGTILSAAMMLELSFGLLNEARAVREAVDKALLEGNRTADIMSEGMKRVSTSEMAEIIAMSV